MTAIKVPGVLRNKVNNSVIQKHANDETKKGVIEFPPKVNNGIVQIVSCGFQEYKTGPDAGKHFFFISMICQEPESVATPQGVQKVRGLYPPRIQIATFAQKFPNGEETSEDENWGRIMNNLRLMGGEKFTATAKTTDDIEKLAAIINEKKPYVRFSSKESKNKKVYTVLHGLEGIPKDYRGPAKQGMKDSTGKPSTNGTPQTSAPTTPTQKEDDDDTSDVSPGSSEGNEPFNEFHQIEVWGHEAQGGDADAQEKLSDLIKEYGIADECGKLDDWNDTAKFVLKTVQAHKGGDEAPTDDAPSDDAPDEKPMPVIGQLWKWRFKSQKTGKPTEKPMLVTITKVDVHKETADFTGSDKKPYKNKPFAELEPNE